MRMFIASLRFQGKCIVITLLDLLDYISLQNVIVLNQNGFHNSNSLSLGTKMFLMCVTHTASKTSILYLSRDPI